MAEKGFGVKEVNLIGASGTPTITSPNNLNLNANNVAISTNVSIGGTLTVTGNVSVGGTLTYEDVTNIDSIGIVTARNGINVSGGNVTIANDLTVNGDVTLGDTLASDEVAFNSKVNTNLLPSTNGNKNLGSSGNRWGEVHADTFHGSGSNLTNLPVSDIQVAYTVTANGSSAYRFAGNGVVSTEDNPDLYLIRGKKYRFVNNSGGSHPFQIRVSDGGSAYSTGVTNNGASSGNIDFAPTYDSPAQLVYQCTSHGGMVGNIYISGGQYHTRSNNLCLQYTKNSSNVTSGTVIYDTEVFDVGDSNAYNSSTGEFTAPVTGVYHIQYEHFATGVGRATANIEKSTNGGSSWSVIKAGMRVYAPSSTGANWPSVPTIYYAQLNANDKIRIVHREGTIHLNTPWNHLTIQLVQ